MSSPMDAPEREPQRLSALYQYHNAPEVAPAHGLEYDDTVYPSSDKYPVIREAPSYDPSNYKGKHAFVNDNRPPRIIFGMKVKTFLVVALVMILVIVGAAVGGAVGGKSMRENQTADGTVASHLSSNTTSTGSPASATSASATAAYSAAAPTYAPESDCTQNDSIYTTSHSTNFTMYCNLANPLSPNSATKIAEAYVYTFSDCVELCSGYNDLNGDSNCTVAVYQPSNSRPSNCIIGSTTPLSASSLKIDQGTDVAILNEQ